jgi:hypothetical protein
MPCLIQPDCLGRGRRQINGHSSQPWTAIIDANRHTANMAYPNVGAERQGAMSRGHGRAIKPFSISHHFRHRWSPSAHLPGCRRGQKRPPREQKPNATTPASRPPPGRRCLDHTGDVAIIRRKDAVLYAGVIAATLVRRPREQTRKAASGEGQGYAARKTAARPNRPRSSRAAERSLCRSGSRGGECGALDRSVAMP